jgi:hypothetical protein
MQTSFSSAVVSNMLFIPKPADLRCISFLINTISSHHRHILYSLAITLTSTEVAFMCSLYFELWTIFVSNSLQNSPFLTFWRRLFVLKSREERFLYTACLTSALLFFILSGLTIFASVKPALWTGLATVSSIVLHCDKPKG